MSLPGRPEGQFGRVPHELALVTAQPEGPPASPWPRALLTLGLLLAGLLVLYRDTGAAMVAIWSRSGTFAHAFTVPPIVAWLIWRKRQQLAVEVPRATGWVLWPIGAAGLAWLFGDLAASNAVAQLAFVALLVLATIAVIGPRASRTIAFPLGFLFFSVPIGEFLMPQMMQWTADFTVLALRASGIPVYREGLQFVVPSGNWSVVEACSGIRYLIASILVGTLFAYLHYRTLRRRLIFVGVSIMVPIVANWVRAYLIVLIGDLSGNVAAVSADHLIYGWVFFGIVITVMFMIGMRWSEPRTAMPSEVPVAARIAGGRPTETRSMTVALAAAVLFVVPPLIVLATTRGERPGLPALAALPTLANGWRLAEGGVPRWQPAFHGTAAEYNRDYVNGDGRVGLYVGYYRHQDYDSKLVSSENRVVTLHDADWSLVESGTREVSSSDGHAIGMQTALLRGSGHIAKDSAVRLMVWQVYWIDGTMTANETWAKAFSALYRLLGRGDDAAVIVAYASDAGGESAERQLSSFLRANLTTLTAQLAGTRDGTPLLPNTPGGKRESGAPRSAP